MSALLWLCLAVPALAGAAANASEPSALVAVLHHWQSDEHPVQASERLAAAAALAGLGDAAKSAVPDLIVASVEDPDEGVCRAAMAAAGRIGIDDEARRAAVPGLRCVLRGKNGRAGELDCPRYRDSGLPIYDFIYSQRAAAAEVLGSFGAAAEPAAADLLVSYADDPEMTVQSAAKAAVRRVGIGQGAADLAAPRLLALVVDQRNIRFQRIQAAEALGWMGSLAQSVVPDLLESASVEFDQAVQDAVEAAVARIGMPERAARAAAARLAAIVANTRRFGYQRAAAAKYLGLAAALQTLEPPVRAALEAASGDSNPEVRQAALKTLALSAR